MPQLPQDKANHVIYGLLAFCVVGLITPIYGLIATVIVGLVKEIFDYISNKGTVEVVDFLATSAGGFLGYWCATL